MKRRFLAIIALILLSLVILISCSEAVSIIGASINDNGELIFEMSDGTTVNAGIVKDKNGDSEVDDNPQGLDFYLQSDGTYAVSFGRSILLKEVVIPSEYKGKAVTRILSNGYEDEIEKCIYAPIKITSVTIPNSVTHIDSGAFSRCYSLKSVVIPDSVTTIATYAFKYCISLMSVTIGSNIMSIGDSVFYGCNNLVEIINNSSIETIKNVSETVDVHKGESRIENKGGYLFYSKNGINVLIDYVGTETALALPMDFNGQSYRILNAFYGNDEIISVFIPNSVTSIGVESFFGCSRLGDIYYGGTQEEWNAMPKGGAWDFNTGNYTITYNYTGE